VPPPKVPSGDSPKDIGGDARGTSETGARQRHVMMSLSQEYRTLAHLADRSNADARFAQALWVWLGYHIGEIEGVSLIANDPVTAALVFGGWCWQASRTRRGGPHDTIYPFARRSGSPGLRRVRGRSNQTDALAAEAPHGGVA
jgi:hypothetical protein